MSHSCNLLLGSTLICSLMLNVACSSRQTPLPAKQVQAPKLAWPTYTLDKELIKDLEELDDENLWIKQTYLAELKLLSSALRERKYDQSWKHAYRLHVLVEDLQGSENSKLLWLVVKADVEKLFQQLKENPDLLKKVDKGNFYHLALGNGSVEMLKLLEIHGIKSKKQGKEILFEMCEFAHPRIFAHLFTHSEARLAPSG